MNNISHRPFYREFAWAYDLIITGPVKSRCDFWIDAASQRGVHPGSRILDAGCGTGSYTLELACRGYRATGIDASPELIAIAIYKAKDSGLPAIFHVGNIARLPGERLFAGILCRGVLNDLISDETRQGAFLCFAGALRSNGVLILDVREWNATVIRKTREPCFQKTIETDKGTLTFRSVTDLDHETKQLMVSESHTLEQSGAKEAIEYTFVMRPWTREELYEHLTYGGFGSVAFFGDYDLNTPLGSTDRIIAVASLAQS